MLNINNNVISLNRGDDVLFGVSITDVTAQLANQANMTDIDGVYVMEVQKESPPKRAASRAAAMWSKKWIPSSTL